MGRHYFMYMMTDGGNSVLYTGMTSDLKRRVYEHREKLVDGFTKRYNVKKLVYYEAFEDPVNAITREKQVKAGSPRKKVAMITAFNKTWADLFEAL